MDTPEIGLDRINCCYGAATPCQSLHPISRSISPHHYTSPAEEPGPMDRASRRMTQINERQQSRLNPALNQPHDLPRAGFRRQHLGNPDRQQRAPLYSGERHRGAGDEFDPQVAVAADENRAGRFRQRVRVVRVMAKP